MSKQAMQLALDALTNNATPVEMGAARTALAAALALPDAQPVMLLHQKDDPYLDPETLRGLAAPIAEDIAKNCGSVPQLVFPYLYLGLREILTLPKTVAALERLSDAEIDAIPWANTGSFTFNVRALARAIEAAIHAKTIQPKS